LHPPSRPAFPHDSPHTSGFRSRRERLPRQTIALCSHCEPPPYGRIARLHRDLQPHVLHVPLRLASHVQIQIPEIPGRSSGRPLPPQAPPKISFS
jgi:hypothetical protein